MVLDTYSKPSRFSFFFGGGGSGWKQWRGIVRVQFPEAIGGAGSLIRSLLNPVTQERLGMQHGGYQNFAHACLPFRCLQKKTSELSLF